MERPPSALQRPIRSFQPKKQLNLRGKTQRHRDRRSRKEKITSFISPGFFLCAAIIGLTRSLRRFPGARFLRFNDLTFQRFNVLIAAPPRCVLRGLCELCVNPERPRRCLSSTSPTALRTAPRLAVLTVVILQNICLFSFNASNDATSATANSGGRQSRDPR